MKRIAIVSRFILDYSGHHYNFALQISEGLTEVFAGSDIDVIVREDCEIADDRFKRMLPNTSEMSRLAPRLKKIVSIIITARKVARTIEKLQSHYDLIIFPDGTDRALLQAFTHIKKIRIPMFLYVHSFDLIFNTKISGKKELLKTMWEPVWNFLLRPNKLSNVYFLTYNEASEYDPKILKSINKLNKLGGKVVFSVPHPTFHIDTSLYHSGEPTEEFVISYLGPARIEKGFAHVVDALKCFNLHNPKVKFLVSSFTLRSSNDELLLSKVGELKQLSHKNPSQIDILDSPLSAEEYARALARSSILLLLYDRNYYKTNFSGILLEAFAYGKPVITTAGTWLAKQVEKYGGGVVVENREPETVLRAIEEIMTNYEKYRAEAIEAGRQLLSKHNSVELAKLIKDLLENRK